MSAIRARAARLRNRAWLARESKLFYLLAATQRNPVRSGMKQNIDTKGRAARGGIAAVFILAGGCLIPQSGLLAGIFFLVGLFAIVEALLGWCAIRACGIKLPF
jgi:hypothetical protein